MGAQDIAPTRMARVERTTAETSVDVTLALDGTGSADVSTGVGFFDHMLVLLAHHSLVDLTVRAQGDTQVDDHHTVEDVGIALGQALLQALGARSGIRRYGHALTPMDEALAMVAMDLSGRPTLAFDAAFPSAKIGTFDTELVREFFNAVAVNGRMTLHVRVLAGLNSHHIAEAVFKGFGHALRDAIAADPRRGGVPSTKGSLES
ncbi:MAG: imidazoleglycerol-phosphate dehydratase HisB [Anaerolineae bacterium]